MISSGLFWLANFRYPDLYLQKEFYTFLALTIPYEVGLFKRKEQQDMWHVEGVGVTVPIMSIVPQRRPYCHGRCLHIPWNRYCRLRVNVL
jgi:hypothetical protein